MLDSRRLVLEHAGYHVTASADLQTTTALLASRTFEIFVLCHSLLPREREEALAVSHSLHPRPLNLILNTAFSQYSGNLQDEITAFCDPETFVKTVSRMYGCSPEARHE